MARKRREFGEGLFYTVTNYIYWFVIGNLYFTILNIPMIYLFFLISTNGNKVVPSSMLPLPLPVVFLCLLPIGPSLTALFSIMGKLVREKDINITRDFFIAYKLNFLQSLLIWTVELISLIIVLLDIRYFITVRINPVFTIIMLFIFVIILSIGLYAFPLLSRFELTSRNILKLSSYLTIQNVHITLANLSCFVVFGFIFFKLSSFVIVFFLSTSCYLIMLYERKLFNDMEARLTKSSSQAQ